MAMAGAGMLLANRYQLHGRIAADGADEVWRASDLMLGRPVAARLLGPGRAADITRFLTAAQQAARVCHPGIEQVCDYGQADPDGSAFLVTELTGTSSLAAVMQAGPLDPAWVLDVIYQVASALDAAHTAGLVHQDIKPGNLLLAPGGAVKLSGFGLSHAAAPMAGPLPEARGYLAPERTASAPATPASDLYSLGMVGWECLTGVPSFSVSPLAPLPATVPAGVAALVADLIATDPASRPASALHAATRSRDLLAAPMRASKPREAGWADATLLLDPPTERSPQPARSL